MFLLIDKPKGITSHDVIDSIRKITGERKVGHAGTLDPNATGLLIVGVGRESTKRLGGLTNKTIKEYLAQVVLGEERDTEDMEGITITKYEGVKPTEKEVKKTLLSFVGEYDQIPPLHSAIKIKGKKAYQLARKGEEPNLKSRRVEIVKIEYVDYKYPLLEFTCLVSSGTYIRSLARDVGKKLSTGAYLGNLRRTKVGKYSVDDAIPLLDLTKSNWKEEAITLK
ncbi:tRNA pseudouridine(55) synthase TruB [Patescibacteria group bacterium]